MLPDKEALELIQRTACEAQAVELLKLPEGDGRTAFVREGTFIKEIPIAPSPRRHVVHSLDDLIAYARQCAEKPDCKPVVWHGPIGVQLILDDDDRRDRVAFPLDAAPQFQVLRELEADRRSLDQREFLRLLRLDLGYGNLNVLQQFRRLNWERGEAGTAHIEHGRESLGQTINSQVQAIDELPDELTVAVPVYRQVGEETRYDVRCAIEIDVVNRKFLVVPVPGELDRALNLAQAYIRERLDCDLNAESDGTPRVPVFYGQLEGPALA